MSSEVQPSPGPPAPPKTEVVLLQGGPRHLLTMRIKAGDNDITLDMGGKSAPALYRRRVGGDSPAGAPFDYVAPPKEVSSVE